MVPIAQNRLRHCKNLLGGAKTVYFAPYVNVPSGYFEYDGSSLTEFPETQVYKFEMVPGSAFEQVQQQNEGGKYYDIKLNLAFNKIGVFDNNQFQNFLKKDLFVIVEDHNGNFFLMGFRNGVSTDKLDVSSTQYKLEINGMEEEMAPFVTDLMGGTFNIVDGHDFIFQDDTNYIFQDDTNYIFQS